MLRFITIMFMTFMSSISLAYNTTINYEHLMSNGVDAYTIPVRVKISNSFSTNSIQKVNDALGILSGGVEEFMQYERRGLESPFRKCVAKYATKDFGAGAPQAAIGSVMTGMVMLFSIHKESSNRAQIGYFSQNPSGSSYTMGNGTVGSTNWGDASSRISLNLNERAVENFDVRDVAGTIFHEIMHNLGWDHPTGYPGSFIKEAGLCIARDNADKSGFGLNGSSEYRIID